MSLSMLASLQGLTEILSMYVLSSYLCYICSIYSLQNLMYTLAFFQILVFGIPLHCQNKNPSNQLTVQRLLLVLCFTANFCVVCAFYKRLQATTFREIAAQSTFRLLSLYQYYIFAILIASHNIWNFRGIASDSPV